MSAADLVKNYSSVGDIITAATAVVLLVLIRTSLYYSNDRGFAYLKQCVHYLLVGAWANLLFAYVCINHPESVVLIMILRAVYHVLILISLGVFSIYIRHLLRASGRLTQYGGLVTNIVFLVGIVMDVLSPITHLGFYYKDGLWYDSTFIKPYTMVYIYALLYFLAIFVLFSQRMIRPVLQSLLITEIVSALLLLYQSIIDNNTYAAFTFLLPIIVVMVQLHSKPFDLNTGAISGSFFDTYIEHIKKKNAPIDYMILRLDTKTVKEIPIEVGKTINSFWHKFFKEAVLFSLDKETFVLAVKRVKRNGDTEAKIDELINGVFPAYYERYQIPYRIAAMHNIDFINNAGELKDYIGYLFEKEHTNSSYIATEKDIENLKRLGRTKACLADITAKQDLNDERVLVFCQPVMNTTTGKYDTAEALMRMTVDGKMAFPDVFIPLAESAGYIHTLSKIILNKVCIQVKELMEEGYDFTRISVNFSLLEMNEPEFCAEVVEIIASHDIPFDKIAFELTESQNEQDYKLVLSQVETLKLFGIKVYLDDFGTGYSNFDRILGLGVDVIKFDRSMLLAVDNSQPVSYILKHFSKAFKELEYKILFEGVENEDHVNLCRDCNADYLQGYKFSKPIPIENLRDFFSKEEA